MPANAGGASKRFDQNYTSFLQEFIGVKIFFSVQGNLFYSNMSTACFFLCKASDG